VPLFRSVQEKRLWIAAAACLLLIWASIYPARAIVDFLRGRNLLRATVAIVFLAAGCGLAAFLLRARPRWREIAALVFGGLAYAVVLAIMNQPEERLHFLEYGALAGFTEAALRARRAALGGPLGVLPSLLAILLTAALGWLDEIIQYFVPVRVYDWRDVGFNAAAGALLVGLAALRRRARARDQRGASRRAVLVGAFAAVAAAAIHGAAPQPPPAVLPPPTNVLLITLDAQRADHLGCYGYPRPTSPRIDELARSGAVFRDAVGHANWTGPGVVTLLTGLTPAVHGMDTRHKQMDRDFPTPLKELARRGWQVGGFQGRVEPYLNLGLGDRDRMGIPIADQLRELAEGKFVLWHHLRHVHLPYNPPPELREQFRRPDSPALSSEHLALITGQVMIPAGTTVWDPKTRPALEDLYDACVRQNDDEVGATVDALKALGLWERTIVVLTADHGEELIEHGQVGHASTNQAGTLYEEILRIPLLVRVPGIAGGRVVEGLAQPIDVMPTVFGALGIETDFPFQGRSLMPAVYGAIARVERPVAFAEATTCGWQCGSNRAKTLRLRAARGERWKLVERRGPAGERTETLFDLAADPGETRDVLAAQPREATALRAALAERQRQDEALARRLIFQVLDDRRAEVRALPAPARSERAAEICDELAMLRYVFEVQNPSPLDGATGESFRRATRGIVELLGGAGDRYWACRGLR